MFDVRLAPCLLLLTILALSLIGCDKKKIPIVIDGRLNEPQWATSGKHDHFLAPWDKRPVPPGEFRAFVDDTTLYMAFAVTDEQIVAPLPQPRRSRWRGSKGTTTTAPATLPTTIPAGNDDPDYVAQSDRVEVFFLPRPDAPRYYCIEIDAIGRCLDYSSNFDRDFIESWNFPGLKYAVRPEATALGSGVKGYTVEISIPLANLKELGIDLSANSATRVGIFWAQLSPDGEPQWLTLIDPKVPRANFHVPSAFGKLTIGE